LFGDARVDQNRNRERKINVLLKSENILWLTVFEYANVFGLEITDEAFVFVGCRKENVSEIGIDFDDFVRILWHFLAVSW